MDIDEAAAGHGDESENTCDQKDPLRHPVNLAGVLVPAHRGVFGDLTGKRGGKSCRGKGIDRKIQRVCRRKITHAGFTDDVAERNFENRADDLHQNGTEGENSRALHQGLSSGTAAFPAFCFFCQNNNSIRFFAMPLPS